MKRKLSIVLKATETKDTKFYRGNITSLVESSPLDTLGLIGRHPGQLCGYSKAYKEHIHECMHAYDLYRRVGYTCTGIRTAFTCMYNGSLSVLSLRSPWR